MTNPTLPSQMPRGTVLVRPGDSVTNEYATRVMKLDRGWIQVSGELDSTFGRLAFQDRHGDAFLSGWVEQSVADWQAAQPEMT